MAEIKPGDTAYLIPETPVYDDTIRKLKTTDPANADTVFNPLFQQIIENIHAVKKSDDQKAKQDLSNVSNETMKQKIISTGAVGQDGPAAAKDLSNVSNETMKQKIISTGAVGQDGPAAAKDLSNVSNETMKQKIISTGAVGQDGPAAARDLSNVPPEKFLQAFKQSGANSLVASKATSREVVVSGSKWNGTPFSQTVTIAGVTSKSLLWISLKPTSTQAVQAAAQSKVLPIEQGANYVKFTAIEEKPALDLTFTVVNGGEL